jgi:predicted transglutaminase-like cysteine proteinase
MKPRRETGGTDVWKTGGPTGDCEDFALTKREELIKAGVSSSAARVATGSISSGERHAVLVVTTEAGEFVMDNLTNQLLPVGRALFTVETIQSEKDPRVWVKVNLRG